MLIRSNTGIEFDIRAIKAHVNLVKMIRVLQSGNIPQA